MEMEKRTIIAIVLSLAILLGYQYLFVKPVPQQQAKEKGQAVRKEAAEKETTKPAVLPSAPAAPSEEKEVRVETDLYSATLSSIGGTIKKWELKKYKDREGMNVFLQKGQSIYPPLSIGAGSDFSLSKVNFNISGGDIKLDGSVPTGSIVFEYSSSGYSIKRTYTFYYDSYKFDLKDEATGLPEYWITLGTDFGISNIKETGTHTGPVLLKDADRIELTTKKLQEVKSYKEDLKWIAQEDKYFFAGIVPMTRMYEASAWKIPVRADEAKAQKAQDVPVIAFKGNPGVNSFLVYAGPKEHESLKKLNVGLEHIIDFGFFSIISRPLFWLLKFFYRFIGNYGWSIILLTLVTRIPFIPLISKSQKAMKKIQAIQPRMNEIKEKYKKDPQRMQKEMMDLYKKHKVNPMGGCLPMLLQIPVFIALYKILSIAIELRGAPFMFWIHDLSLKDPYYILPIVMGITMVIQQRMTPSSADPQQNKIMMLMPVIFTFMFLNFASGLVLYWLVNNILSIAQQFYVNKELAKETFNV